MRSIASKIKEAKRMTEAVVTRNHYVGKGEVVERSVE
jgi:hypothetical protein